MALQAIPAIFLFLGVFFCNESPRWLARNDDWEQAAAVISRLTKSVFPTVLLYDC
ncbi:MAG: hypothetical protein CL912_08425 [Deltaproteobacteria bacterium]|nr:hypothetical protein [Deltaproteobacteria bacterium]